MNNKLKLALFSSSPYAIDVLLELAKNFDIKLVVTSPDKPIGRKQEVTPSPLKKWAIENHIQYETPTTLKNDNGINISNIIKTLDVDVSLVIDYGLLIPAVVFNSPRFKTLNIHFSNLPKYRGPYPDTFVVLNGEKKTAISCVCIDEGFDTGRVLAQKEVEVKDNETAGLLHERLYTITAEILPYIINSWAEWNMGINVNQLTINNEQLTISLPPKKQNESAATFTKKLDREDGFIEWKILSNLYQGNDINPENLPALIRNYNSEIKSDILNKIVIKNLKLKIYNWFLALSPWPGVWTTIKLGTSNLEPETEKRLKILKAHLENNRFIIDEVQLEGKRPVAWEQFCEAYII